MKSKPGLRNNYFFLERQDYDLVLMDIQMQEMDGLEAAHRILKRWKENGPKIIEITAIATESNREIYLDAGMDADLSKPVKVNDLAEILRHNLDAADES